MRTSRFAFLLVLALGLALSWTGLRTQPASAQCLDALGRSVPCPKGDEPKKPTRTPYPTRPATATPVSAVSTPDCAQLAAYCSVPPSVVGSVSANPGSSPSNPPPGEPPGFSSSELIGAGLLAGLILGLGIPPIVGALQPYTKFPGAKPGQNKGDGSGATSAAHKHLAGVKYEDVTISESKNTQGTSTASDETPPYDAIQKGGYAKISQSSLDSNAPGSGQGGPNDSQFAKSSDAGGQMQSSADQAPQQSSIAKAQSDANKGAIRNTQ